jgi:H/ACA ribonucleoprotein complex subunit 3
MKSDIRVCRRDVHDRPVYTLGERCPACDAPTDNSAPAPFDPADPYGEYRRRARRRARSAAADGANEAEGGNGDGDGVGNEHEHEG